MNFLRNIFNRPKANKDKDALQPDVNENSSLSFSEAKSAEMTEEKKNELINHIAEELFITNKLGSALDANDIDPLLEDAARLIVMNQVGSTSLLQRRMRLGYDRAGRLMDQLEAAGIVGANQGSKAREVLIKTEMDLQQHLDTLGY